jgi:acyl carrier protein
MVARITAVPQCRGRGRFCTAIVATGRVVDTPVDLKESWPVDIPQTFQDVLRPHLPFADSGELVETNELAGLGLDSMSIVGLLADIEDRYDVELPDDILNEATFATVGSLWLTLSTLVRPGGGPEC